MTISNKDAQKFAEAFLAYSYSLQPLYNKLRERGLPISKDPLSMRMPLGAK